MQGFDAGLVAEDEVGALVGSGPPREADGEDVGVEPHPRLGDDRGEHLLLERLVRRAEPAGRAPGLRDARVLPRRHVDAVRDRDDGARALDLAPHGPRYLSVELGDGVGPVRQPEPRDRHVERVTADRAHLGVDQVAARAEAAEGRERVGLVPGGDGRVGGEHDPSPDVVPRGAEVRAGRHPVGDHLDAGEDGVALVEVVGVDVETELRERADAPDAEEDLLCHSPVEARLVEPVRDPEVAGRDRLEEEERRVAPALGAPDPGLDFPGYYAYPDADAGILEEVGRVLRELVDRDAVRVDALPGVSARPAEPHADDRKAEVPCRLHEVAGEDPEPARVRRELLVEPELHAEVRDARRHSGRRPCVQRRGG